MSLPRTPRSDGVFQSGQSKIYASNCDQDLRPRSPPGEAPWEFKCGDRGRDKYSARQKTFRTLTLEPTPPKDCATATLQLSNATPPPKPRLLCLCSPPPPLSNTRTPILSWPLQVHQAQAEKRWTSRRLSCSSRRWPIPSSTTSTGEPPEPRVQSPEPRAQGNRPFHMDQETKD